MQLKGIPEQRAKHIFKQILEGIHYLHKLSILSFLIYFIFEFYSNLFYFFEVQMTTKILSIETSK